MWWGGHGVIAVRCSRSRRPSAPISCPIPATRFYYSVENAQPGIAYRFNIINMEKPHSQFNEGQRPLLFSEKEFTSHGVRPHPNYRVAWSCPGWVLRGLGVGEG